MDSETAQAGTALADKPPVSYDGPLILDIYRMANLFGMERPYPWQIDVILDVVNGKPTTLLAANGSGKTSSVIALAGLYFMAKWPGAKVVSTSGSFMQIATQLCPVLRRATAHLRDWKYTEKKLCAPEIDLGGLIVRSEWNWFSTDEPGRAEGHHKDFIHRDGKGHEIPLLYIIDEGKSVDGGIYDAKDRCRKTGELIASSPGEDFGSFYDCVDGKSAKLYTHHKVVWTDCPHLYEDPKERKKIENDIRIKGRSDPLVGSQYFAEWIRRGGLYVFESEKIRYAMSGNAKRFGKDLRAAVDYSQGGDEQVLGIRTGNHVEEWQFYHEKNAMRFARICIELFNNHGVQPDHVTVDCGGAGKEFADILESKGWIVNRYLNNAEARDKNQYANRYTEDCFEAVAYRLEQLSIPQDEVLERQMRARKYQMPNDDSNRKRLQPKEELRKHGEESPDRLDCLIMLFSDLPDILNFQKSKMGMGRFDGRVICPPSDETKDWKAYHGMRVDQ